METFRFVSIGPRSNRFHNPSFKVCPLENLALTLHPTSLFIQDSGYLLYLNVIAHNRVTGPRGEMRLSLSVKYYIAANSVS